MKFLNYLTKTFNFLILTVLAFTAVLLTLSVFDTPLKLRFYTVNSGSMEPAIKVGSLIVTRPSENYGINDVITFRSGRSNKDTVTHRVVKVERGKDLTPVTFITKGDANNDVDQRSVSVSSVLGKVVLTIPYIGFPLVFAKTQVGFIFLIVVPATLIIFTELQATKKEIIKHIEEKKKRAQKLSDLKASKHEPITDLFL